MQHPWVGPNYGVASNILDGKRILVVGESHYGTEVPVGTASPGITIEVVNKYQSGEWAIPFLSRIVTLISGKSAASHGWHGVRKFWDDLAFYNYVPVFAGVGPREFDWSLWALGEPEYNQVLDELKPDVIVVTGYRLWDNAYIRHTDRSVKAYDRENNVVKTLANGREIPTLKIKHPSAPGFSGLKLHPQFKALLETV